MACAFIDRPVAFPWTSTDGIDEWVYGVVSGYTSTEQQTTLHIICHDGSLRLPLNPTTPVIKVDELNYALQTGGRVNTAAVTPTELLEQQNKVIAACQRRRSGIPVSITKSMSVPFAASEMVPLIRPTTLQLARVRRQHIVDFTTTARSKRPVDLYVDKSVDNGPEADQTSLPVRVAQQSTSQTNTARNDDNSNDSDDNLDEEATEISNRGSSDDEDVQAVQHTHRPLSKRRRIEREEVASDSSSDSCPDERRFDASRRNRGVIFHPSPTDRQIHAAVARRRHAGKEPQMLLQSAQQSQHLDFIGTPPVLCGAYYFGFGVGLSIMHFRRALPTDEVVTTENAVNMRDFSSKNSLPAPPRANSLGDLFSALSAFHKFAKYFYNKIVQRFIGLARDFIISYADSSPADPVMARLLTYWVNGKLSKFRSRLVTSGIRSALRVRKQFSRTDEQLAALKESYP